MRVEDELPTEVKAFDDQVIKESLVSQKTQDQDTIQTDTIAVPSKRTENMTMQIILVIAIMSILFMPILLIVINLFFGNRETIATQAFALYTNLSGIIAGGLLGFLTGSSRAKRDEK